ncbi:MAG: redox-regulated ATPase YchF [Syntrophomonadaceae bacterium]|nr:redox-regulated ATPase YchF [Syntrophomonadaceae bacterium]
MLTSGLIGLPMAGKTTFFNLLTRSQAETSSFYSGKTDTNRGTAIIPDDRLDFLSHLCSPRRTTYAQLEVVDLVGLVRGASEGLGIGNAYLSQVRTVDALIHVVRVFRNPDVHHIEGEIDPLRDIETINLELLLADLEMIKKRMERIEGSKKKTEQQLIELSILNRILEGLNEEKTVHSLRLSEEESTYFKSFGLLTEKPMILVANLDEEQLRSGSYPQKEVLHRYARDKGMTLLEICAQAEMEISQLSPDDQQEFLKELGISEPGISLLARSIYKQLNLISFFTIGDDEVKAWTIKKGTSARSAAGKIHSDLERGFIRAEVVKFSALKELGSMSRVKEKGLFRLEGKDYTIMDGDVVNIRFNV